MKIFQKFGIYLISWIFLVQIACGPIYRPPAPPESPTNEPNTHPELDSSIVKSWIWSELTLPPYTWPDGIAFGNGLFVDFAFDVNGVKIEGDKLRFFLDPINPAPPATNDGNFNYRSEIRTAPWQINHPLGSEHWIGWTFTFEPDYIIDPNSPITIFQNHPGVVGSSPMVELEIAGLNRPRPAKGGEIQVVNHVLNTRFVTDFSPQAGQTFEIVLHIVFDEGANGLFQVWINGELIYNEAEQTVFDEYPWGGNNKWGIYHHSHRYDTTEVNSSLAAGADKVSAYMGPLKLLIRDNSAPNYRKDAFDIVKP